MSELVTATDTFAATFDLEEGTCDPKRLSEYASKVRDLCARLNVDYAPDEGRSRLIEKFFAHWNNLVFGVMYAEESLRNNGNLTERQRKILSITMAEIRVYAERYGAFRRRGIMGKRFAVSRVEGGVRIDADLVAGKENELVAAFGRCVEGDCRCPTEQYRKLDGLTVETGPGRVAVSLKEKAGQRVDIDEITRCLEYTLNELGEKEKG